MGANSELELKVASGTNVGDLASVVARGVNDGRNVSLRFIGAGAGVQAIKAVAVARGMVAPNGIDLLVRPGFTDLTLPSREPGGGDTQVTAIVLKVVVD